MTRSELVAELLKLDAEERLQAAEELWESVAKADALHGLSDEQLKEIESRIEEHERDPSTAIPWEVAKAELLSRFK
jgi:putative addiction module component (TIGR02574 family)